MPLPTSNGLSRVRIELPPEFEGRLAAKPAIFSSRIQRTESVRAELDALIVTNVIMYARFGHIKAVRRSYPELLGLECSEEAISYRIVKAIACRPSFAWLHISPARAPSCSARLGAS